MRVLTGLVAGQPPSGFSPGDTPPYVLDVNDGDIVYACIVWDVSGETASATPTSVTLGNGQSVPADAPANGTWYYRIGSVAVTNGKSAPANDRYGPISTDCYRLWFAASKTFAVTGK